MDTRESPFSVIFSFYWHILLILVLLFLSFQNSLTILLELPTFIDEILQACMLVIIAACSFKRSDAKFVFYFYIATTGIMLALSYPALSHRGISNVLQQVFVHSKYIIYLGFTFLFIPANVLRPLVLFLLFISTLFMFVDLSMPGMFNELLDQTVQIRGGVIRPIGIQGHTGTLGFFMAFIAAYYFFYAQGSSAFKALMILFFVILILVTTVRTAMFVFPVLLIWGFRESIRKSIATLGVIGLIVIGVGTGKYVDEIIEITQQNIQNTIENPTKSAYIRGMMLYFSFELATDRFPIGTGAATFGTVKSDDSQIYAELGVQNSRFFVEKDGIYDSNFASLLGEFGYFGMLAFYISFIYFCFRIYIFSSRKIELGFMFASALLMIAYSVTNPVFMNTYQIFIFSILFVGCVKKNTDLTHDDESK